MCCDGEQVNTARKSERSSLAKEGSVSSLPAPPRSGREGWDGESFLTEVRRPTDGETRREDDEVELAEKYWRDLLPNDFPDELIVKAAFWFGASRRVNASLRNRLIAAQINDILDRKAWVGTDFGELVFTG
jgi:hypothetical protein